MSNQAADQTYHNISEVRGKKRIWLEGGALLKRGFIRGVNYTRLLNNEQKSISLIIDSKGKHVVSGKAKNGKNIPIIDIVNNEIADLLGDADRVRVDYIDGRLEISVHHLVSKQRQREQRFLKNYGQKKLTEGTLCVGIGMSTLALHEGFAKHDIALETKWIADREPKYLQVAIDNNPSITNNTRIITASLEEIEPELISQVDIAQFSLGCTGHSKSGKAKNKNKLAEDHKSDATSVYGVFKLLESINAGIYISENVTEAKDSATYSLIKGTLKVLGYNVYETTLDNTQSGSFECRPRYWMIAVSSGIDMLNLDLIPTYERKYNVLGDLMESIPDDSPQWSDNQYLKDKAIRDAEQDKGFAKRQLLDEKATQVGAINRHYNKRQSTPPYIVKEDGKERLLTPVEHCRVKDCIEALVKDTYTTIAHQGLGQGIDMNQCRGLAEMIAISYKPGTQQKVLAA